jgi:hypothetical protein
MPFHTAQKNNRIVKKWNSNKDYRCHSNPVKMRDPFGSGKLSFDYIMRTKHGIHLNEHRIHELSHINMVMNNYTAYNMGKVEYFEEHSEEENALIQQEWNTYRQTPFDVLVCSKDMSKSDHSKRKDRDRQRDRWDKLASHTHIPNWSVINGYDIVTVADDDVCSRYV